MPVSFLAFVICSSCSCLCFFLQVESARKADHFSGKASGPTGAHMKVAAGEEHLASIAELAVGGGALDRFVVANDEDRELFLKTRKEAGCASRECCVFQQSSAPHRHNVREPPNGVETVASTLVILEDLVFNCLVDQRRVDCNALSPSVKESESALSMQKDNNALAVRGGTENACFLPQGDCWFVRNGSRSFSSDVCASRQSIGVDKTAVVEQAKKEAKAAQAELEALRQKDAKVKKKQKEHTARWNEAEAGERKTRKSIEELEKAVEEIKAELKEQAFQLANSSTGTMRLMRLLNKFDLKRLILFLNESESLFSLNGCKSKKAAALLEQVARNAIVVAEQHESAGPARPTTSWNVGGEFTNYSDFLADHCKTLFDDKCGLKDQPSVRRQLGPLAYDGCVTWRFCQPNARGSCHVKIQKIKPKALPLTAPAPQCSCRSYRNRMEGRLDPEECPLKKHHDSCSSRSGHSDANQNMIDGLTEFRAAFDCLSKGLQPPSDVEIVDPPAREIEMVDLCD